MVEMDEIKNTAANTVNWGNLLKTPSASRTLLCKYHAIPACHRDSFPARTTDFQHDNNRTIYVRSGGLAHKRDPRPDGFAGNTNSSIAVPSDCLITCSFNYEPGTIHFQELFNVLTTKAILFSAPY